MLETLLPWGAILAGFIGLVWSADRFVESSACIAANLGLSKLVIGLTIVAFGTSAPEALVSISASLKDTGTLAIGNALGSNLANVGLVLGITALIAPLPFKTHVLKQEFVIMLGVMGIAGFFLYNNQLSHLEGLLLVGLLIPLLVWIAHNKRHHPDNNDDDISPKSASILSSTFWFITGLGLLIVSTETLVWGATTVALSFGVSPLIIGLTIVAIGTSLPELAASVTSALKGHHDIAIGNVIGSNMFNLLLVMGIAPIIHPLTLDSAVFNRDFLAMTGITLVLGIAMLWRHITHKRQGKIKSIGRYTGLLLLSLYIGYGILLL